MIAETYDGDTISLYVPGQGDRHFIESCLNETATRQLLGKQQPIYVDLSSSLRERLRHWISRRLGATNESIMLLGVKGGERVGMGGFTRLNYTDKHAEIWFCVASEWQGEGYGTALVRQLINYGFDELGLHKVVSGVRQDNTAAMHIMDTLGCRKVGKLSDDMWMDGEFYDVVLWEALRSTWNTET